MGPPGRCPCIMNRAGYMRPEVFEKLLDGAREAVSYAKEQADKEAKERNGITEQV